MSPNRIPTVVFVDDEINILEVYQHLFTDFDIELKTFKSPEAAVSFINQNLIDLCFFDYKMPQMSGAELRNKISKSIPCYLVTGLIDINISGFEGVIPKPFYLNDFIKVLKHHHLIDIKPEVSI